MIRRTSSKAFTLIELVVALGVMSTIVALALMALQSAREAARLNQCRERLRGLALGLHAHEASRQHLPPGTNSLSQRIPWETYRLDQNSPLYWKRYKATSFLVYLLPYLERSDVSAQVPNVMLNYLPFESSNGWFGTTENYGVLNALEMSDFYCPSDNINGEPSGTVSVAGGSQPVFRGTVANDLFSWHEHLDTTLSDVRFQGTNYLACSGAVSGGRCLDVIGERYRGIMASGGRQRLVEIQDGTSNSILCGETLGTIKDGQRVLIQPWYTGGLARTRGLVAFGAWNLPEFRSVRMLGNPRASFAFGFGSAHPAGVNFAMGDGAIRTIDRTIDPEVLSRLGGAFDGMTVAPL